MRILRRLALGVLGAAAARGVLEQLRANPPGGAATWERKNHRGEPVTLLAGPAAAGTAALTAALGAPRRLRGAAFTVTAVSGAVGIYDDLCGESGGSKGEKGLRGHLGALREGRVTSGLVKIAGVGGAGVLAAGAITRKPVDRVIAGGVIAGTANLVNLLDLRPGRALKASLLLGAPLLAGRGGMTVAGPIGVAAGLLPEDLGEQTMLGDGGANALGAVLGVRLAAAGGPKWRAGVLAGLVGLTLASEKVSFTKVIESTPGLRDLDALGRRPTTPA